MSRGHPVQCLSHRDRRSAHLLRWRDLYGWLYGPKGFRLVWGISDDFVVYLLFTGKNI